MTERGRRGRGGVKFSLYVVVVSSDAGLVEKPETAAAETDSMSC